MFGDVLGCVAPSLEALDCLRESYLLALHLFVYPAVSCNRCCYGRMATNFKSVCVGVYIRDTHIICSSSQVT